MIQGIDVNQRIEFISEYDKTEPKTVFVLKPLTGFEMIALRSGESDLTAYLEQSVVEIRGVEDKNALINALPINVLGELIKKANEINEMTEQETKN